VDSIQIGSLRVWRISTVNSIQPTHFERETAAHCVSSRLIWRLRLAMNWIGSRQVSLKTHATRSTSLATELSNSDNTIRSFGSYVEADLLYIAGPEKRVNRSALIEFLSHELKYVFPPRRGSMVRGVLTAASAEPLKSRFLEAREPPAVCPYAEGKVRGISLAPLYKGAPKAALQDPKFYGLLALCDAIRSGRARERNLAVELLEKEINV
jgi:hypothetical protein